MSKKFIFIGTNVPQNPVDLYDEQINTFSTDGAKIEEFFKPHKKILDVRQVKSQATNSSGTIRDTSVNAYRKQYLGNITSSLQYTIISETRKSTTGILEGFRKLGVIKSYNTARMLQATNIQIDKLDVMSENANEYYTNSLAALSQIDSRMGDILKALDRSAYMAVPVDHFGKTFDTTTLTKVLDPTKFQSQKYFDFMNSSASSSRTMFEDDLARKIADQVQMTMSNVMHGHRAATSSQLFKKFKEMKEMVDFILPSRFQNIQTANPIISKLLSQIGINTRIPLAGVNTLAMDIESVPFDTITRKAIVEIIPSLLAKIHGALTGKSAGQELVYDIPRQQFVEREVLANEYGSMAKNAYNKDFQKYFKGADKAEQDRINMRMSGINRSDAIFSQSSLDPSDELDNLILQQYKKMSTANKAKFAMRYGRNFLEMLDFEDRTSNSMFFSGHRMSMDTNGGINYGGLIDPGTLKDRFKTKPGRDAFNDVRDIYNNDIAKLEKDRWATMFMEPTSEMFAKGVDQYKKSRENMFKTRPDIFGSEEEQVKNNPDLTEKEKVDLLEVLRIKKLRKYGSTVRDTIKDQITNVGKYSYWKDAKMPDLSSEYGKMRTRFTKVNIDPSDIANPDVAEHINRIKKETTEKFNQFNPDVKERYDISKDIATQISDAVNRELFQPLKDTVVESTIRLTEATRRNIIVPLSNMGKLLDVYYKSFKQNSIKGLYTAKNKTRDFIESADFKLDMSRLREQGAILRESIFGGVNAGGSIIKSMINLGNDKLTRDLIRKGHSDKLEIEVDSPEWKRLFKNEGARRGFFNTIKTYFFGPLLSTLSQSSSNIVETVKDHILTPILSTTVSLTTDALKMINSNLGMLKQFATNTKEFVGSTAEYFKQFGSGKSAEDNIIGTVIKKSTYIVREVVNGVIDPFVKKTVASLTDISSSFIKTLSGAVVELNDKVISGIKEIGTQFRKEFLEPVVKRLTDVYWFTFNSLFGGKRGKPGKAGVIGDIVDKLAVLGDYYREKLTNAINESAQFMVDKMKEGVMYAFDGFKKATMWQLGKVYEGFNKLIAEDGIISRMMHKTLSPVFGVINKFINRDKDGSSILERFADRLGKKIFDLDLQGKLAERRQRKIDRHMKVARLENPIAAAALDANKSTARHTADTVKILSKMLRYQQYGIGKEGKMIPVAGERGFNPAVAGNMIDGLKMGLDEESVVHTTLDPKRNPTIRGNTVAGQLSAIKEREEAERTMNFRNDLANNTGITAKATSAIQKGFSNFFPWIMMFGSKLLTMLGLISAGKGAGDLVDGLDSLNGSDDTDPKKKRRSKKGARTKGGRFSNMFKALKGKLGAGAAFIGANSGKIGRFAGKAAVPLTAGMALYDGYQGIADVNRVAGTDNANFIDYGNSAISSALSGLSFGMIDKTDIANSEYNPFKKASGMYNTGKEVVKSAFGYGKTEADVAARAKGSTEYAKVLSLIESGGNQYARNASGATGLYQFLPSTWNQYGNGGDIYDVGAQERALGRFTEDNARYFRKTMNRDPSNREKYLLHQQGMGGATKLLSNPNALAKDIVGEKAVTGNGGSLSMTANDFAELQMSKYDKNLHIISAKANDVFPDGSTGTLPKENGATRSLKEAVTKASKPSVSQMGIEGAEGMFAKTGVNVKDLHPRLLNALKMASTEYYRATGKQIGINSGYRDIKAQAELYRKSGGDGSAAKPGSSMHNFGLAVDIDSKQIDEMEKLGLLAKYGLTRPIRGETWHLELANIDRRGIRMAAAKAGLDGSNAGKTQQVAMASQPGIRGVKGLESEDPNWKVKASAPSVNNSGSMSPPPQIARQPEPVPEVSVQQFSTDNQSGLTQIGMANRTVNGSIQSGKQSYESEMVDLLRLIEANTKATADKDFTVNVPKSDASKDDTQLAANLTSNTNVFTNNHISNGQTTKTGDSAGRKHALEIAKGGVFRS